MGAVAASLLALVAPLRAQGRAPAAPAYEEGTFDLVVAGAVPTALTVLVSPRGTYLLPVRAMLEPLGIPHVVDADSLLLRVTRPGGAGSATLRWGAGARALDVGARTPLDSTEVVVRAGTVYLAAPRLAQLIEGTVDVDLATLTIRAARGAGFPAQIIAGVHERRGLALRRGQLEAVVARPSVPFRPTTGFGVMEWALAGSMAPVRTPGTVESRVGMGLYGGLLKVGGALLLPTVGQEFGSGYGEASYQRVFPDGTLLRQVQVGDIFSAGAVARSMRGVAITNAPYVRSLRFGEIPFSRPLPPGWEYEVYQGDRLIGFADAATHTALAVPVQYGMTPLRVRLYGPAGETVESTVSYVIPVEQLPEKEWQYALGGGRCGAQQCRDVAYADVRHGVTRWLTLQAGVDEVHDDTARTVRPYGAASWLPAPGWTAQLQARQGAYLRAAVQRFGEDRVTGSATVGANAAGEGGIPVTATRELDGTLFAQTSLQLMHVIPALGERGLTLATRMERRRHGGGGRWDVTSFVPIRLGMLETGVQSSPLAGVDSTASTTPLLRIAPTLTLTRGAFARLGAPLVRVEAGFQGASLAQWDVGLSFQPGRGSVNMSARHLVGTSGAQVSIGGSVALGVARALAHVTSRAGELGGAYSVNGAVAFGSVRRATALDYGGLGLAGIEGRVFRDRDGDGRFSAGDEVVPEMSVGIGGLRTQTDSAGRYAIWNVLPYEQLEVEVDSLGLQDPAWVPAVFTHSLRPSPQQYTRVDFPLVHTREVIGRLAVPLGGVGLELRGEGSGVLHETRTFGDGAFYLTRVRPGRYVLTLSPASQRALGQVLAEPLTLVVPPDGDEVVEMPPIRLVPAPPASQVPGTIR